MANIDALSILPELVRDSRMHATFQLNGGQYYTVHTLSHRRNPTQEAWVHMESLGQGGQGSVDLQMKDQEGPPQFRAVKNIRIMENQASSGRCSFIRELEAISKFSQARYSELFVKSYGWYTSKNHIHITMEYCELGDLQKYLMDSTKCPQCRLPENEVCEITSQVLNALSMMHQECFTHRDLKPANILVVSHPPNPWWVKIGDFGISKRNKEITESTAAVGTPGFVPPEMLGFFRASTADDYYAVDMWCLGETVFRILVGRSTFKTQADLSYFCQGHYKFPEDLLKRIQASEMVINFLSSLIAPDPKKRLKVASALDHPWIETHALSLGSKHGPHSEIGNDSTQNEVLARQKTKNYFPNTVQSQATSASASWTSTLVVNDHAPGSKGKQTQVTQASSSWATSIPFRNPTILGTRDSSQTIIRHDEASETIIAQASTVPSSMFSRNQAGEEQTPEQFSLTADDMKPTYMPVKTVWPFFRPRGCQHYETNVKPQCFTCKKWYTCRLCHDEVEDHKLVGRETRNMLCMLCNTPQKASNVCTNCGERSAKYYCNICKLWSNPRNNPRKSIYHCEDCGICRKGIGLGKDFFHCKTCRACISMGIASSHKCIEGVTECDCPICGEYMFLSRQEILLMLCGHSIHTSCYRKHIKVSNKCPVCRKTLPQKSFF